MCMFRKPYYFYNPLLNVETDPNGVTFYTVTVWKTVGKKTRPVYTFVSESYKEVLSLATDKVNELSNCHK